MRRIIIIIIVVLAAAALGAGGWWWSTHRAAAPAASPVLASAGAATKPDDGIAYWTCSMHPEVRAPGPGSCPICKMDLIPVMRDEGTSGEIVVDEARRQAIGLRLATAERREVALELRVAGVIAYDETRVVDVAARSPGWVTGLGADAVGKRLAKGDLLFALDSPELAAAQGEYLAARAAGDAALLGAARSRLGRLGLDEAGIARLDGGGAPPRAWPISSPIDGVVVEKAIALGARVEVGARALRLADDSRVWLELAVHEEDLGAVRVGQRVAISIAGAAPLAASGEISFIAPEVDPGTRAARARVELANPDRALKPGMFALGAISAPLGERLVVPEDAVVYAGESRVVFVDLGDGRIKPRRVRAGAHPPGAIEILDGLQPGERVVASAVFLIASESRIRSGRESW